MRTPLKALSLIATTLCVAGGALWHSRPVVREQAPTQAKSQENLSLTGPAAVAYLKERGLYESLTKDAPPQRYAVRPDRAGNPHSKIQHPKSYVADNPRYSLKTRFTQQGVKVSASGPSGKKHLCTLRLKSVGYGQALQPVAAAEPVAGDVPVPLPKDSRKSGERDTGSGFHALAAGNDASPYTVSYRRGNLTEWYVNDSRGVEQGFTLAKRPEGGQAGEPLRLALAVEGDLHPQADSAIRNPQSAIRNRPGFFLRSTPPQLHRPACLGC